MLRRIARLVEKMPMKPRYMLAAARIPDTAVEMRLYRSGDVYSIKVPGRGDLMNSRMTGSEKDLARLAFESIGQCEHPRVLIGGLGMGFHWLPRSRGSVRTPRSWWRSWCPRSLRGTAP